MKSAALIAALALVACGGGGGQPLPPAPVTPPAPAPSPTPPPAPSGVVLVGDELVSNWQATAPATYPAGAHNGGVAGATAVQLAATFQADVLARRPAVVVLSGGLNDLRQRHALDDQATLFRMAEQAATAGVCVVLVDLLPADVPDPIITYNQGREVWAASYGYRYVAAHTPLAAGIKLRAEYDAGDGLHINAAGYGVLGPLVAAGIARCQP